MLLHTYTTLNTATQGDPQRLWISDRTDAEVRTNLSVYASDSVSDVAIVRFDELNKDVIAVAKAEHIFSHLFNASFDGTELALKLQELGYKGTYTAIAHDIPDPTVILRDVRTAAPHLKFDLIVTSSVPKRLN